MPPDQIRPVGFEKNPDTSPPTRTRHWVLVFAMTLAVITYIDRICISQASPEIRRDLGLTDVEMGYAFGAFFLAYGIFEIPGGWLGDSIGPRRVLTRIVVMWSFFTAATGWARGLVSLLAARFMFGAGEAGCFPNLTKVFATWLPPEERTRAQGIMWMSARWGGAFTPMLVVGVLSVVSWRSAFMLFGVVGVVWAFVFHWWYWDQPREHRGVNAAELALLSGSAPQMESNGKTPWRKIFSNRSVWLLCAQYFCLSYGWHFYITWLPVYLQEARGLTIEKSAFLAGFPLFFGGLACLLTGVLTSRLAKRLGSLATTRRLLAFTGFMGASAMLLLSIQIENPTLAMVSMGLASFANDLTMPGSWSTCMDIGGRFAGTLSGTMNMMASFAAAIAPVVIGYILQYSNRDWILTFWLSAAVYFLGGLCWIFIDPVTPIVQDTLEL